MTKASTFRTAINHALALTLAIGTFAVAAIALPGAAAAQGAGDACPGPAGSVYTYAFNGIPSASADLVPSVRRSISILGMRANNHDCSIRITCVSGSKEREARRTMDRQCSVTRGAVFAYERRSMTRDRLRTELDIVKMTSPGDGFSAGLVYVSLIAK